MRGKWAAGIPPRNFTWIIRDRLALSERPGGFSASHRRVRRQEEIIWLKGQEFNRVISLLSSPHNLQAYDENGIVWANYPLAVGVDPRPSLFDCYKDLEASLMAGLRVLMHQDELGDRMMGTVAGYLLWSGRAKSGAQASWLVERLVGRQMGSDGRELLIAANELLPPGSERVIPEALRQEPESADTSFQGSAGSELLGEPLPDKERPDKKVPGGERAISQPSGNEAVASDALGREALDNPQIGDEQIGQPQVANEQGANEAAGNEAFDNAQVGNESPASEQVVTEPSSPSSND